MMDYQTIYRTQTHQQPPAGAARMEPLFAKIARGEFLPPRAQQAVDLGFTAHAFNDAKEDPPIYQYYNWVVQNCFAPGQVQELTAQLIGADFISANVFRSDLPQPLTLNPWQLGAAAQLPLLHAQAIIVENNGVFATLWQRHPTWPLINQGGNNFNRTYLAYLKLLERRGVALTYLGDLDSAGIQIADHLSQQLTATPLSIFTALQTPSNVSLWVGLYGIKNVKRTAKKHVSAPVFQAELMTIMSLHKFVEQEQLLAEYESLIESWLAPDATGSKA